MEKLSGFLLHLKLNKQKSHDLRSRFNTLWTCNKSMKQRYLIRQTISQHFSQDNLNLVKKK